MSEYYVYSTEKGLSRLAPCQLSLVYDRIVR